MMMMKSNNNSKENVFMVVLVVVRMTIILMIISYTYQNTSYMTTIDKRSRGKEAGKRAIQP